MSEPREDLSIPQLAEAIPAAGGLASGEHDFGIRCVELRLPLAGYLRAMLPDHFAVEDCLQDTFALLWEKYAMASGEDFRRLAFTCAKHKALQWLEKNKVARLAIVDPIVAQQIAEAAAIAAESQEPQETQHRAASLRECLARLAPAQRELLEARYGGNDRGGMLKLAAQLGRKADALYKQLERVRAVLKTCVENKLAGEAR